jgi:hypothetical protein
MTTNTPNQGIVQQQGTDPANLPGAQTAWLGGEENRLFQRYLTDADRVARNAAPNEGEVWHLAAEDRDEQWNGSAAISMFTRSNFQLVRRTTDAAAINANIALQSDATMVTTFPAVTGVFKWRDVIFYSSSQAADYKIAYLFTAGTVVWGGQGLSTTAVATVGDGQFAVQTVSDTATAYGGAAVGTRLMLIVEGEIVLTGTGTNLTLRYAQNTSDATNTIPAYAGSYRQVWRMS